MPIGRQKHVAEVSLDKAHELLEDYMTPAEINRLARNDKVRYSEIDRIRYGQENIKDRGGRK